MALNQPQVSWLWTHLPDLVTLVSASPQCNEAVGVVTCDIGDLNSQRTVNLTIMLTAAAGGIASNTAVVSSDNLDPNPNNNTDTAETTISEADIVVSAPALDLSLLPDETVTMSLTIENIGQADLLWNLAETIPVSWLSEQPDSGTLGPDDTIEVEVAFDSSGLTPGLYETIIVISSNDPDNSEIMLPANLTVIEREADLQVEKTASANIVNVGDTITYTLTITNNGPQEARGVILTDTLPSLVSLLYAPAGCTETSGVINCEIGDLAVDATVTLTIAVTATGDGYSENNVEVSSEIFDPDLTNNTDLVSTRINPMMVKLFIPFLQRH